MKTKKFKLKGKDVEELSDLTVKELTELNSIMVKNMTEITEAFNKKISVVSKDYEEENIEKSRIHEEEKVEEIPAGKGYELVSDSADRLNDYSFLINNSLREVGIIADELVFPLKNMFYINKNIKNDYIDKTFDRTSAIGKISCTSGSKIYDEWRKSIKNSLFQNDNMYKNDIIYRFQFLSMPTDEQVLQYISKKEYDEYKSFIGILKSAYVIYTCYGLDNIYNEDLKNMFIDSLVRLGIFFTRRRDYTVNAGYLKVSAPCLYLDYNTNEFVNDSAGCFKTWSDDGKTFEYTYYCDRFVNQKFSDSRYRLFEEALINNYHDFVVGYSNDPIVMYSLSEFNSNKNKEFIDCDNKLFTEDFKNDIIKLKMSINMIYKFYIEKIIEASGSENPDDSNPYMSAVANDNFLRENRLKYITDDFRK